MKKETTCDKFPPSPGAQAAARRVFVVVFDRFQLLDATGPAQAFATSNEEAGLIAPTAPFYEIRLISSAGGAVASSSGITLLTQPLPSIADLAQATVIVAGGPGIDAAARDERLLHWLTQSASHAARVCSVCTGTFALAACGLLDGKEAVTHWRHLKRFAEAYPTVKIHGDSIFVKSGSLYSSAGVTAGIDLCLNLIEEDRGRPHALAVAKRLVVYIKRPGGQLQFSSELLAQTAESRQFDALIRQVKQNPAQSWSVEELAAFVSMSARSFHRQFVLEMGVTPSQFISATRLEKACMLIESTQSSLKAVARTAGLGNEANMKNLFLKRLGVTPSDYLERFRATKDAA